MALTKVLIYANFYTMSQLKNRRLPLILILANSFVLLFHIGHVLFKIPSSGLFFIENDHSLGEFLGYAQELGIISLLVVATFYRKQFVYLAWALLFAYLAVDDSFQIHERLGSWLSQQFDFGSLFGLRPQDFGELLALAVPYGLLILAVILAHIWADNKSKGVSRVLLPMLGLLIFFGVILDMLHIKLEFSHYLDRAVGFIEDGGEMVVFGLTFYRLVQWTNQSKVYPVGLPKLFFTPLTTSVPMSSKRK
jgi:hypothetical protein